MEINIKYNFQIENLICPNRYINQNSVLSIQNRQFSTSAATLIVCCPCAPLALIFTQNSTNRKKHTANFKSNEPYNLASIKLSMICPIS